MIVENFPNMGKDIVNQVQDAQRVPGRIKPRRNAPRHTVIKQTKIKDRLMKQQITYKGTSIRLPTDSSIETLQPKREWHDIFKVMKGKNLQPRILYPAKLSFRFDGEIKTLQTGNS